MKNITIERKKGGSPSKRSTNAELALMHQSMTVIEVSAERVEQIIRSGVASLSYEGLFCTEEDIARMRRVASGETKASDEMNKIIAKYQQDRRTK